MTVFMFLQITPASQIKNNICHFRVQAHASSEMTSFIRGGKPFTTQ